MPDWIPASSLDDGDITFIECSSDKIQLRQGPRLGKLLLQLRPDIIVDTTAIGQVLGEKIPTTPNEKTCAAFSIFWQAPNSWLLVSASMHTQTLQEKLSGVLSGNTYALDDLSDSRSVIEISGEKGSELLAQGCGVDLCPDSFPVGHYYTTELIRLAVIIHRLNEDTSRVYVDRSVALHLWQWLMEGAGQYS